MPNEIVENSITEAADTDTTGLEMTDTKVSFINRRDQIARMIASNTPVEEKESVFETGADLWGMLTSLNRD